MATPRKDPADFKKRGRPPKPEVDPAVAAAICNNLSALAMPLSLAAEAEGVHRSTIYDWIERFPDFARQITRAKATAAKNLSIRAIQGTPLKNDKGEIVGYSMKGSSAAAWMLERRFEDYRPVTKVISAEEDEFAGRSREELEIERDRLAAKVAAARS